jgi:magnesium-protoporphyrin O-methyltransferase
MSCCAPIVADTGRLFSRFAAWHRWRFRLLGFERTQRQLIEGIRQGGMEDAELLEIGCGPGYLHRELLRGGAERATGVDLSEGMLDIARSEAQREGLAERTDYRLGDFTRLADTLPDAEVVILDKVVCCYPDWQTLVDLSLRKSRRLYALTYPRDRRLTRAGLRLMRWGLGRFGCCYQPYIHDPERIQAHVREMGLRPVYQALTATWITQVFARDQGG